MIEPPLDEAADKVSGFEGFSARPYLNGGGVPTIGLGTTHYPSGLAVTLNDAAISMPRAVIYLQYALHSTADRLWPVFARQPTLNEWSAVLSLAYNEGAHAIAKSTLLRLFNAGNITGAAAQFPVWDKLFVDGHLVACQGLLNRRIAERALFLTPDAVSEGA
jgi:lysozyme